MKKVIKDIKHQKFKSHIFIGLTYFMKYIWECVYNQQHLKSAYRHLEEGRYYDLELQLLKELDLEG